jgi:AAA family ATPase
LHKAILAGGKVKMSHFEAALSESIHKSSEPPIGMFA